MYMYFYPTTYQIVVDNDMLVYIANHLIKVLIPIQP